MEKKSNKKAVKAPKTAAPVAPPPVQVTEAQKIWDEIKGKEIQMFALPNQVVAQYCKPITVEPSKLYLLTTASAVLPSLEAAVGQRYVVEVVDKYTVVSRATTPFKK